MTSGLLDFSRAHCAGFMCQSMPMLMAFCSFPVVVSVAETHTVSVPTGHGLQAAQMQELAHSRSGPAGTASAASQSAQAAKWAHLIVQRFVALTQINQVRLHWLCCSAAR